MAPSRAVLHSTDLALALVVFIAVCLEAIVGFGSTVVTVTFGVLFVPLDALLAAYIPVNMVLSLGIAVRDRRAIDTSLLFHRMLPLVGLGTLVGIALFHPALTRPLLIVFGLSVVALSALQLNAITHPERLSSPPSRLRSNLLLTLAGILHGLFGVAGPLVVFVLSREVTDKQRFRATLAPLWFVLNAALVANYFRLHLVTASTLTLSASFLPALALGALAGQALHTRVAETPFKLAVSVTLLLAGLATAINQLLSH